MCLYPQLLEDKGLPLDVKMRAQRLLEVCEGGSVGEDLQNVFFLSKARQTGILMNKCTDTEYPIICP